LVLPINGIFVILPYLSNKSKEKESDLQGMRTNFSNPTELINFAV
jgi:hypothetical protein